MKIFHLKKNEKKWFSSLIDSKREEGFRRKIRNYQKNSKKFLKILRIDRKFRKKLVIFRAKLVGDWKIIRFLGKGEKS
jgi:predicted glycosyltransferase involved in capsule biosynthesis